MLAEVRSTPASSGEIKTPLRSATALTITSATIVQRPPPVYSPRARSPNENRDGAGTESEDVPAGFCAVFPLST